MTTEEILKLIRGLKKAYDIKKILITGGEPLTQKNLCEIVKEASGLDIKTDLVTNGILLTEEMIRKLDEAGLKRVRISIDELGDSSKLRAGANPNMLWKVAKRVMDTSENIEVCIHTVCSPANVNELFEVYQKVLEVGAARWRVFDIGFQGGITNEKEKFDFSSYYSQLIMSTREILEHYISHHLEDVLDIEINNIFRTALLETEIKEDKPVDIDEKLKKKLQASPCDYVADHQLTIRSNGNATLCQYFHNTMYDFKKYDYDVTEALKHQERTDESELLMKDMTPCKQCKYCHVCNGGCRSRAQYLTGDIKDADPVSCYLYPMFFKQIIPILPEKTQKAYGYYINSKGSEPKYSEQNLRKILERKGY